MPNRRREPSLVLFAIIGLILYLGVNFLSSAQEGSNPLNEETGDMPIVTRMQAADAAIQFVRHRFELSQDIQSFTMYQSHMSTSGYVQKENVYDDYIKRYSDHYPLDYFEVEINDHASGNNYFVDVNYTNLNIIGFEMNKSAASKNGAVSSKPADQVQLAVQTIKEMGYVPEEFALRNNSGQTGNTLVFQSKTDRIGEAPLQLQLKLSGGKTSAFHPLFAVPEAFTNWQQQQDDRAAWMTRISVGVTLIMTLTALITVIRYRREISFGRGVVLTLLFLAIYIANNFNMMPAFRTTHGSGPTEGETVFYLWFLNIFVALMAVSIYFSFLAGRRQWQHAGLDRDIWPVWRQPHFGEQVWTAMKRGYLICLFIMGIQQAMFFIATEAFGVWAVNDPADSVYNMIYPVVFPLMAWAAAISEEAMYRLFGIAFFLKLTRNRFLAVLVPSVIWAMSHTQYPIYPVYTRLIEVTILGLVFGYAFLRYGFLTALFAHASMDSILMGLSLMVMGNAWNVATGILYLLFPALIGWLLYRLHRMFKRRPPVFQ